MKTATLGAANYNKEDEASAAWRQTQAARGKQYQTFNDDDESDSSDEDEDYSHSNSKHGNYNQ